MTFLVSGEVAAAVASGGPVVALESSVIGQGLPHPQNLECAWRLEEAVRGVGAVPAWTGVEEGMVRVGLEPHELELFSRGAKVSRRWQGATSRQRWPRERWV